MTNLLYILSETLSLSLFKHMSVYSSFSPFSVCTYACVCVCMRACTDMHTCVQGDQRLMLNAVFSCSPLYPILFEAGSLAEPGAHWFSQTWWIASPRDPPQHCKACTAMPGFSYGCRGQLRSSLTIPSTANAWPSIYPSLVVQMVVQKNGTRQFHCKLRL